MSSAPNQRSRGHRASLPLPPGRMTKALERMVLRDSLQRIGLCFLAAVLVWWMTGGWRPPFSFRTGFIPPRDLVVRVAFTQPDPGRTEAARRKARSETVCIYVNDPMPLTELREGLKNALFRVLGSTTLEETPADALKAFLPPQPADQPLAESAPLEQQQRVFTTIHEALAEDSAPLAFEEAMQRTLAPWERRGLLDSLEHGIDDGSQTAIQVHPLGDEKFSERVEVSDVLIAQAAAALQPSLVREFQAVLTDKGQAEALANLIHQWIRNTGLPATLHINRLASEQARDQREMETPEATFRFRIGDKIASGGWPLSRGDIGRLAAEHEAWVSSLTFAMKIDRTLALFGLYLASFVLCGYYIYYHQPSLLTDMRQFAITLALAVLTVGMCVFAAQDAWRAEIAPLALFAITIAIAHHRELALLFTAVLALIVTLSLRRDLGHFVILTASVTASVLLVHRVRSRTKLIYVALFAALVAFLTTLGVGALTEQVYASAEGLGVVAAPVQEGSFAFWSLLLKGATWRAFCMVVAGLLITGLLPFVERLFDVQTDISLLELGDAAHPLLQELARRAPGTYNHSLNVASLAEVAAEAIGANGLLCRVGAYFHDIGKMLKPQYFIENQGGAGNRHHSLLPAMSTLVIIAHVKDGADLARQHHLPRSIVDFIEQHHGTTLVEYFYRQEQDRAECDPDAMDVDESSFRYPGPRPQTKETAVIMLADAAESALRALNDPAPARIEGIVREICMKRLLDDQFSDCGITLAELHIVQDTLVKSLTAVYHGRVKYPDQQTA